MTTENIVGKPRRKQTPAQEAAAKRNYAGFQLKGMLGHLGSLHGHVPAERILDIRQAVQAALSSLEKPVDPQYAGPKVPYLESWYSVVDVQTNQLFIRGMIFGSSKHADNTPVRTSYLVGANRAAGTVQTTSGSTYLLQGGDHKEFDRICLRFGA